MPRSLRDSRLGFTAKSLRLVNVSWHASTTPVHVKGLLENKSSSRGCQNTGVIVGYCAAEMRPYIYPRNVIYNDFLGSAILFLCFFLLF